MNYRLNVNPLQNNGTRNFGLQEEVGAKICCQPEARFLLASISQVSGIADLVRQSSSSKQLGEKAGLCQPLVGKFDLGKS